MPPLNTSDSSSLKKDLKGAMKEISSLLNDSKYTIYSGMFTAMSIVFCVLSIAVIFAVGKQIQDHGMQSVLHSPYYLSLIGGVIFVLIAPTPFYVIHALRNRRINNVNPQ